MDDSEHHKAGTTSRRRFLRTASAVAAAAILPAASWSRLRQDVRVGAISYSFRSIPSSAEEILGYMTELGLSVIELMGGPAEQFAGAPKRPAFPRNVRDMPAEERQRLGKERRRVAEELKSWRASASMDRFEELGRMYADAGVDIDILKLGNSNWSDAEIDYAFTAARAVGARGISFEISNEAAERMAPFAVKHDLLIGMHNHVQVAKKDFSWDIPLSFSPNNMLNVDIGHYVAAMGATPVPLIRKYHDRITHLHLKDRRSPDNGGANVPWGHGDTPIAEVLQLLKAEAYPITAMIELEYDIPEESTVMVEMKKCVDYCKDALA